MVRRLLPLPRNADRDIMVRVAFIFPLLLAFLSQPLVAAPSDIPPIMVANVEPDVGGTKGNGLVARQGTDCIVITVNRLLDTADIVTIRTTQKEWEGERSLALSQIDIATVVTKAKDLQCPSLPAMDAIARALERSDGYLVVSSGKDGAVHVPVNIIRRTDNEIRIQSRSPALVLKDAMLGAPIVIDGIPVAILTGFDASAPGKPGIAFRLDQAARIAGRGKLPIVEITVLISAAPLLDNLKDALARADGRKLRQYVNSGINGTDIAAALRLPIENTYVVTQMFETIAMDPTRVDAVSALLDGGLSPNLVLPARRIKESTSDPPHEKALIWHAIDAGSAAATVALLTGGASPHGYTANEDGDIEERMLFPTEAIKLRFSDRLAQTEIYAAMAKAGLVIPRNPMWFKSDPTGNECPSAGTTCAIEDRGRWITGWDGDDWRYNDAISAETLAAVGSLADNNFSPGIGCLVNQVNFPRIDEGWNEKIAAAPNHLKRRANGTGSRNVVGFLGVFKNMAWFMTQERNYRRDMFLIFALLQDGVQIRDTWVKQSKTFQLGRAAPMPVDQKSANSQCRLPAFDE